MSFYIRGLGWCRTTEEDAASATTPSDAFDRVVRLAYHSFLAINLLEPEEYDRSGRRVMNPWEHIRRLQAMKEMVTLTGEAIDGREAWRHRRREDEIVPAAWIAPGTPEVDDLPLDRQPDLVALDVPDDGRRRAA
jgi:hypothetical protein